MVFLLYVGRLPLAISRIVSRNRILCEAALFVKPSNPERRNTCEPEVSQVSLKSAAHLLHNLFFVLSVYFLTKTSSPT